MRLRDIGWVALGGMVGALCRYWVGLALAQFFPPPFPVGTFAVNIIGSFVIGALLTWLTEHPQPRPAYRLVAVTGFLGAFTTFSSYSNDMIALVRSHDYSFAAVYWLGSVAGGLGAVWLGYRMVRKM